jgi:hypothetical protein
MHAETHPYAYVLLRQDLPLEQQIVQASHASYEAGFRFEQPAQTTSIILLSVPDRAALEAAAARLARYGIEHHMFFEPDFEMGHSALATRPLLSRKERHLMRKYPLFKAKEVRHAA